MWITIVTHNTNTHNRRYIIQKILNNRIISLFSVKILSVL